MTRFEKVCWLWSEENRYLRETIPTTVRFECLLHDYDYFRARVLEPISASIDVDTWSRYCRETHNPSPAQTFPHWRSWSREQRHVFSEICGREMEVNGYELDWGCDTTERQAEIKRTRTPQRLGFDVCRGDACSGLDYCLAGGRVSRHGAGSARLRFHHSRLALCRESRPCLRRILSFLYGIG